MVPFFEVEEACCCPLDWALVRVAVAVDVDDSFGGAEAVAGGSFWCSSVTFLPSPFSSSRAAPQVDDPVFFVDEDGGC